MQSLFDLMECRIDHVCLDFYCYIIRVFTGRISGSYPLFERVGKAIPESFGGVALCVPQRKQLFEW